MDQGRERRPDHPQPRRADPQTIVQVVEGDRIPVRIEAAQIEIERALRQQAGRRHRRAGTGQLVQVAIARIGLQPVVADMARQAADAGHPVVEEPTAFPAVPGMGWCFVADPDGNWVELVGPV